MEMKMQIWIYGVAIMLAAGMIGTAHAQDSVTLMHVHGLSYSADGKRLMIPSHHGVAVYEKGKWSKAPGPQHDYMGFSATSKHLYSSGHPAPGSGLVNPFGLIRSRDGGKTWDKLGLEGETDFHVLATSWHTNAIYVWNPAPQVKLPPLTKDAVGYIAQNPVARSEYAIATFGRSVYLSKDAGRTWTAIAERGQGK